MSSTHWTCPFCDMPQIRTKEQTHYSFDHIRVAKSMYPRVGVAVVAFACSNPKCEELTIFTRFSNYVAHNGIPRESDAIELFQMRPLWSARTLPDYIPRPIREDYIEACKIRDLSPKASATMARRCLQGMIRDFAGISGKTLDGEIKTLSKLLADNQAPRGVDAETIEAIDHVRRIGNIGAHMEQDINLVIPVDAGEAQALIELIETLFEDWYIARHNRAERLKAVKAIRDKKDDDRKRLLKPDH